jgi:hypothetical protein
VPNFSDSGSDAFLRRFEGLTPRIKQLTSTRKVRPVVTPSGKRARGNFPSVKAPFRTRYESLLEQDVLRVAEVSSLIRIIRTHPMVLALPGPRLMHYTPDALFEWPSGGALIEVKATFFLTQPVSRERLREILKRLTANGLLLVLIVEHDVRKPGFQDELKELLRLRPRVGRYRPSVDPTLWDPLGQASTNEALKRRWRDAQRECDALLERVMRRDPDDLIAATSR